MTDVPAHQVNRVLEDLAREMRRLFRETLSVVTHPGEKGIARERLLREYLERFIPDRFAIDSGFVIDSTGQISRQSDIVVYDRVVTPVFELPGGIRYFPVEGVVAVGEVKSTVDSAAALGGALDQLESVLRLNRYTDDTNLQVAVPGALGHLSVPPGNTKAVNDRVLSFIFTSDGLKREAMISALQGSLAGRQRAYWPNMVVDFDKYLISYLAGARQPVTLELFPDEATHLYATQPSEADRLVLIFASLLANFLRVARVVSALPLAYFGTSQSAVDLFPLPSVPSDDGDTGASEEPSGRLTT